MAVGAFPALVGAALLAGTALSAPAAVRAQADALLAQVTPDEKAAQLSQFFYVQSFAPMDKGAVA